MSELVLKCEIIQAGPFLEKDDQRQRRNAAMLSFCY